MTCASYGSSSNTALFYQLDADPSAAIPTALTWAPVPFTSESLDAQLSSTISEQITPQRSYANSKLSQGEVGGNVGYEVFAGTFMENMLIAALQANKTMILPGDTRGAGNWADAEALTNGSTNHCLMFLKRVQNAAGNYDMYIYRGCQIGSLSMTIEPGNLITGDISIMGTGLGNGATAVYEDVAPDGGPLGVGKWEWGTLGENDLMSGVDSLKNFEIQNSSGTDLGIIPQNVSITIDNQLRQQFGVGTGSIYAAGVASGRFMTSFSLSAYYANPAIFTNFTQDTEVKVVFGLKDSSGIGFDVLADKCKITSGSSPMAGGPDQDLLISTEIRAFEDDTHGTVKFTLDLTT